jgi:hypothetical protein
MQTGFTTGLSHSNMLGCLQKLNVPGVHKDAGIFWSVSWLFCPNFSKLKAKVSGPCMQYVSKPVY